MRNYLKAILVLACLLPAFVGLSTLPAAAACGSGGGTCFWIGDSGTWDNATDTAHWSATTGGSSCNPCEPQTTDAVTFDVNSCITAATCTITPSGNFTNGAFTQGACGSSGHNCTFAFNTNNTSPTFTSVSLTTSGTSTAHTTNCGTGTWTVTGTSGTVWANGTVTNETLTCTSGTISFAAAATGTRTLQMGNKSYNIINVSDTSVLSGQVWVVTFSAGGSSNIAQLNLTGPVTMIWPSASPPTLTGASTWTGASGSPVTFESNSPTTAAVTLTSNGAITATWAAIRNITFAGTGSLTATNSFDLGGNSGSGLSITAPSGGGGNHIIGS